MTRSLNNISTWWENFTMSTPYEELQTINAAERGNQLFFLFLFHLDSKIMISYPMSGGLPKYMYISSTLNELSRLCVHTHTQICVTIIIKNTKVFEFKRKLESPAGVRRVEMM